MKTEKIIVEIVYGSEFQEQVFANIVVDILFNMGTFIDSKHKKNKFSINGKQIKL